MPIKKCPVCGVNSPETQSEYHKKIYPNYRMKNYKAHIRKIAEREIFLKTLLNDNRKTPHFSYYKKHMVLVSTEQITVKI